MGAGCLGRGGGPKTGPLSPVLESAACWALVVRWCGRQCGASEEALLFLCRKVRACRSCTYAGVVHMIPVIRRGMADFGTAQTENYQRSKRNYYSISFSARGANAYAHAQPCSVLRRPHDPS